MLYWLLEFPPSNLRKTGPSASPEKNSIHRPSPTHALSLTYANHALLPAKTRVFADFVV